MIDRGIFCAEQAKVWEEAKSKMDVLPFNKTKLYKISNKEAMQRQARLGQLVEEEEEEEEKGEREEEGTKMGEGEEVDDSNAKVDEKNMDRTKFHESSTLDGYVGDVVGVRYQPDKVPSKPWLAQLFYAKKPILSATFSTKKEAYMAFDCAARFTYQDKCVFELLHRWYGIVVPACRRVRAQDRDPP
jgi:hypothetical protein